MLDTLVKNFWFENAENMQETNIPNQYEESELLAYIRKFQSGDFQAKQEFCEYFLSSTDQRVFTIGMRLFMAVAGHEDFALLEETLSDCSEWQIRAFLAYVQESLSLHAIPYLLALFEDWEETEVGKDIARYICVMLGQEYYEEDEYDIDYLGDLFTSFADKHDMDSYYYNGEEYFAGNLTKILITIAMDCLKRGKAFYTDQIPSILSNSSGIKCPVSYGTIIDDEKIKELYDYVMKISQMEQKKGEKYFYNYRVR